MTTREDSMLIEPPPGGDLAARSMKAAVEGALFGKSVPSVKVGRYELGKQIGAGGMGTVYEAIDRKLDRKVAIKLLTSKRKGSTSDHARLLREAKSLAKLSHPNVVQVHEVGEHEDSVFLAMELVDEGSLDTWQKQEHSVDEVLDIYRQAAAGLGAAHAAGLVHRDFKPGNMLVGSDGRVRVADFGLARSAGLSSSEQTELKEGLSDTLSARLTATGTVMGTPAYMAPEQVRGKEVDARTDQFSFCMALYEALVGKRPFTADEIRAAGKRPLPAPAKGSRKAPWLVERALRRGLRAAPDQRWPDMNALMHAVDARGRWRRRLWTWAAPVALSTAAVAVAVWEPADDVVGVVDGCGLPPQGPHTLWNSTAKASIERAIGNTTAPNAATLWVTVRQALDAHTQAWTTAYEDSCRDDGLNSAERSCLQRHSRRFETTLIDLNAIDRASVNNVVQLVDALEDPITCVGLEPADTEQPADPEVLFEVDKAANALRLGRFEHALAGFDALLARRLELAASATLAEILDYRGRALSRLGRGAEAARAFVEAAETGSGTLSRPRAFIAHATLAVEDERWSLAEQLLTHAEIALESLAPDEELRADLFDLRGAIVRIRDRDPKAAIDLHRKARQFRRPGAAADGGHSAAMLGTLVALANALAEEASEASRIEARQLYEDVRQTRRARTGLYHPDYTAVLFDLALLDQDEQEPEAAQRRLEQALSIERQIVRTETTRSARTLAALANLHYKNAATIETLTEGLTLARQAWNVLRDTTEPPNSERMNTLRLLATLEMNAGQLPSLDPELLESSLAHHKQLIDENRDEVWPDVPNNVAYLLCLLDRCAEGRPYIESARAQLAQPNELTEAEQVVVSLYVAANAVSVEEAEHKPEAALESVRFLRERLKTVEAQADAMDKAGAQADADELRNGIAAVRAELDPTEKRLRRTVGRRRP